MAHFEFRYLREIETKVRRWGRISWRTKVKHPPRLQFRHTLIDMEGNTVLSEYSGFPKYSEWKDVPYVSQYTETEVVKA